MSGRVKYKSIEEKLEIRKKQIVNRYFILKGDSKQKLFAQYDFLIKYKNDLGCIYCKHALFTLDVSASSLEGLMKEHEKSAEHQRQVKKSEQPVNKGEPIASKDSAAAMAVERRRIGSSPASNRLRRILEQT